MSTKTQGRGNVRTRRNLAEFDASGPYQPRLDPGEVGPIPNVRRVSTTPLVLRLTPSS